MNLGHTYIWAILAFYATDVGWLPVWLFMAMFFAFVLQDELRVAWRMVKRRNPFMRNM